MLTSPRAGVVDAMRGAVRPYVAHATDPRPELEDGYRPLYCRGITPSGDYRGGDARSVSEGLLPSGHMQNRLWQTLPGAVLSSVAHPTAGRYRSWEGLGLSRPSTRRPRAPICCLRC